MPVPAPPLRRVPSAAEVVAKRSGLTVLVVPRRGLVLWAVARTVESTVLGVRSGWIVESTAGPRWGQAYAEAVQALVELAPDRSEPVFSPADAVCERLLKLGLIVDPSYPPAAGMVAAERAITETLDAVFTRLDIATDASVGHRTPWAGHGWVLDFGKGLPLRPGLKAVSGGSILESELRAIRLALAAAKNASTGILNGRCTVNVYSDNLTAVTVLNARESDCGRSTFTCRDELQRIRTLVEFADIRFLWVKGHADHRLNILADRLAVMARRRKEADLPASGTRRMAAEIVEQENLGLAA